MGKAKNFIGARVSEGHEDIVEHVSITLRLTDNIADSADHRFAHGISRIEHYARKWEGHSKFIYVHRAEPRCYYMTANARVWRDICQFTPQVPLIEVLYPVAPMTFKDLLPTPGNPKQSEEVSSPYRTLNHHWRYAESFNPDDIEFPSLYHVHPEHEDWMPVAAVHEATGIKVTHLGTNLPVIRKRAATAALATSTFLVEHVSRACTHQLVRHRRASFSQESQRYVDLDKGQWEFIMPPSIRKEENDSVRRLRWDELMEEISFAYGDLRELGVRKEDARFVLPNAVETRLIVTMPHDAWLHFCWLRALDKAAQWEIRALSQVILQFLKDIHPDEFYPLWQRYLDGKKGLEVK